MIKLTGEYLLFIVCSLFIFVGLDCKHDLVTPIEETKPGSRNYMWTVDTIYAPNNLFGDITGSAPNDLWTTNTGDAERILYHYDGKEWNTDLIPRVYSPTAIYSLNKASVWSSGMQGRVWHFDGIKWSEKYVHAIQGYSNIIFNDIYVLSESNIYAVGQYSIDTMHWGVVIHFDGNDWKQINIAKTRSEFLKIRRDISGRIYIWGVTNEQFTESTYQLYELYDSDLIQIKSGKQSNDQLGNILQLGDKIYFIIGYDFFSYKDGQFIKIGRLSNLPQFINAGVGRNTKDIFIGLLDGIAHYNGENTEYLVHFLDRVAITGFQIFEKDIFVIGWDLKGNNLIYHGKLNE